jgi:sugar/nucleoside kinase (ribokinase family)
MKYDVLALGDYYLDLIFTELDGEPGLGREVFSKGFSILPGGTYNAVAALQRLGVKVAWATDFGNDEISQYVYREAIEEGLDQVCFSIKKKTLRNITVAGSYNGDRQFISYSDPRNYNVGYIKRVLGMDCRMLFISGLYTGRLLSIAADHFRKKGTLLVMDGNSSNGTLHDRGIINSLHQVDIFMPNGCEARRLTGDDDIYQCLEMLGAHTRLVVIKDGVHGAYAINDGKTVHVESIKVKCVDTTGAGDCFDAGFMKAYLDGNELVDCLRWGNIVGGLSTQGYGGTGCRITTDQVQRLKRKHFGRSNS